MSDNQHIANAVERWSDELIDIGGRNRLLFYKPLRSGTIDFRPNDGADQLVVERLLAGDSVRLSEAVPDDDRIMRRGRAIRQKSREHEEEQGIRTLYLGRYLASWSDKPGREPAAPIFLSAVEIKALGRLGDDFELERVDEWELNPSLLHYLRTEFQVELDDNALQEAIDSEQWDRALDLFRKAATEVAELEIADRIVLATFSYAKLPMVRDLDGAHDAISRHQFVAALTGDPKARGELRNVDSLSFGDGDDQIPDDPPPQDEFLILDADGSQSRVINAALQGRNLVVVGPPGTGKSQTIANLIATLTARGKSTLFVAEKRAAIDAVTKRLHSAGLEDLVLDLHEGVRSRRQMAEQLAKALEATRRSAEPDVKATHRRLNRSRQTLSGLSDALHQHRKRWNVSVYDLYARRSRLGDAEPAHATLRNRRKLRDLTPDKLEAVCESLDEYLTSGGALLDRDPQHVLAQAHRDRTIKTDDAMKLVEDLLDQLVGDEFEDLEDAVHEFCEQAGILIPVTVGDARNILEAFNSFQQAKAECVSQLCIEPPHTVQALDSVILALSHIESSFDTVAEVAGQRPRTLSELRNIIDACDEYERACQALSAELGVDAPDTFDACADLLAMLSEFDFALEHVDRSLFDADLQELHEDLDPAARGAFARLGALMFSRSYRRARTEIRALARDPASNLLELRDVVGRAGEGLSQWRDVAGPVPVAASWDHGEKVRQSLDRVQEVLGDAGGPLDADSREAGKVALEQMSALGVDGTTTIQQGLHLQLSEFAATWKKMNPNPTAVVTEQFVERFETRHSNVVVLVTNLKQYIDSGWQEGAKIQQLGNTLNQIVDERALLRRLPRLEELRQSFSDLGIKRFVNMVVEQEWSPERAKQAVTRAWIDGVLSEIGASDKTIGGFDEVTHRRTAVEYCDADRKHIAEGPPRVRRAWAEAVIRASNQYPNQQDTISHQARLKRRHMSTRQLVQVAPDVLKALKPCWAMSPLLVPQILPRQQLFDVVIFDEASQILPADAVSSLLRGRHAVIAGDPKQLPPTTFFTSTSDDYEEEEDDDDATEINAGPLTNDVESVLDAVSTLMPASSRTLSWHYRSLDERLIAFSNHQIYDGSLTTFPGLLSGDCVAHVEVPFSHESIASGGSNSAEVRQVVDLILDHAERRPHESLGVIAFGLKHAHRIEEFLRLARKERPELDEFFGEEGEEPFFVKNLERVQGDERDAIILTVGYGRTQEGKMRYNFGPLNREGGYRRLNVAVTRAKRRMTIVSAFSTANMDPDRLRSQGPQMLRDYIAYAESAGGDLGSARRDAEPLNPFEIEIKNRLEAQDIPLQPQYGASGYWIDFAAMHPEQPGRPVLAIEADGARYHSAINARERDRLRQEHLERLSWRFHRIWSTEWFRNPEAEVEKVVQAWKNAVADVDKDDPLSPSAHAAEQSPSSEVVLIESIPSRRGNCPHVDLPGRPIIDYSDRQLDDIVRWARSDGLLHSNDELIRDIAQVLGYRRVGSRIRNHLENAITRVDRSPQIRQQT